MDAKQLYECHSLGPEESRLEPLSGRNAVGFRFIEKFAREQSPCRVCELSVGDGILSEALLCSVKGVHLTCADISEARLDRLSGHLDRSRFAPGATVEFLDCDFDRGLRKDLHGSFDVVVAFDIMEHVFDVFGFVDLCRSALRPRGSLLLRVPNVAYIRHRVSLLGGQLPITSSWFGPPGDLSSWRTRYGWDGGHLHLFTIPLVSQLLREGGLTIEAVSDPGARFERLRDLRPTLLYANPLFIARRE